PVTPADDAVVVVVGVAGVPVPVLIGVGLVGVGREEAVVRVVENPVPVRVVDLERLGQPYLVCQDVLDAADVGLRGTIPVTREPSTYTSPHISSAIAISQPGFLPLVAGTPDPIGIIEVECGAQVRIGPRARVSRWNIRTPHLKKPHALTTMRLGYASSQTIPQRRLHPVALLNRLRSDDVLVDSPLACGPLNDLIRGAREVPRDSLFIAVLM